MKPSSATEGFFQAPPVVENQFLDDEALQRALKPHVLSSIAPSLASWGSFVISPEVLAHVADAERNPPYLVTHTTFGARRDRLVTSAGWRALQGIGIRNGMVATAYERRHGAYSRVHQFALYHLWTGSAAFVTCPSAMTDGAARLLRAHAAENPEFAEAAARLVSRDDKLAWTSGQWMTERAGGSDVAGTETVATWDVDGVDDDNDGDGSSSSSSRGKKRGPWSISGFKWFSSATDGDMAVLLARTARGLSAFYAPVHADADRSTGKTNGIRIQRLKNKMGSKALPTAELELDGMRAYLIGEEGRGVREIATVLNITRVHTAVSAIGFWGRGLAIARSFAKVRAVREGTRLVDVPAHVATLADQMVEYRAWTFATFFAVLLLGKEECPEDKREHHLKGLVPADAHQCTLLLRLLTPVIKAQASKAAIHGLQECMEALGGVGYLENEDTLYNIARLFRDCNVLSIWEGTTNIMADDLLRVVKGRQQDAALSAVASWLKSSLATASRQEDLKSLASIALGAYEDWQSNVRLKTPEQLRPIGREIMQKLGHIVCSALLIVDAASDRTDPSVSEAANKCIYISGLVSGPRDQNLESRLASDRRLVVGPEPISGRSRANL